jgi:hypothetical protein
MYLGRVTPQLQSLRSAAQHHDPPPAALTHRHEIRDQGPVPAGIPYRVSADHGEAQPCSVGEDGGSIVIEEDALRGLHRKWRERITAGGQDERPH